MSLTRRILFLPGRALASHAGLCLLFVLFFVLFHVGARYRNFVHKYPDGRGFPHLTATSSRGPTGETRHNARLRYSPRKRVWKRGSSPYMLEPGGGDPGVFQTDFIYYTVTPLGEDHIRVRMRHYGDDNNARWDLAIYEATPDEIIPIYINGGAGANHFLVSAILAAVFAWFMSRLGKGMVFLSRAESFRQIADGFRACAWYEDPLLFLVFLPFVFYLYVQTTWLMPYNAADSYAYLWRRPFNWHFFTGRCLTQRLLYLTVMSNVRYIAVLQLGIFALTACTVYTLVRRFGGIFFRLAFALFLAFFFSSYTLNMISITAAAEPVFFAMSLLFPAVLFLWPRKTWFGATLIVGIFFILSKNVCPYVTVGLVGLHAVLGGRPYAWRRWLLYVVLIIFSIAAAKVTQRFDGSVDLNMFNNMCQRVLPYPEEVDWFVEHYDMPHGDFLKQISGENTGVKIDGRPMYTVRHDTMNFEIIPDKHGFLEWVMEDSRHAYARWLFLKRPLGTWKEYAAGYNEHYKDDATIRHMHSFMGPAWWHGGPSKENIAWLGEITPDGKRGFWGIDSLTILRDLLGYLGFSHVYFILFYAFLGACLLFFLRYDHMLALSVSILLMSQAMFFMSYFGDAAAYDRHVLASYIVLLWAGPWYLISAGHEILLAIRNRGKANQSMIQQLLHEDYHGRPEEVLSHDENSREDEDEVAESTA
ncbi:MAG: hypothetical protein ACLFUS_04605 [Candidatus Sumerlaeia bacterium]